MATLLEVNRHLAHTDDVDAAKESARTLNPSVKDQIKSAIVDILTIHGPMPVFQLRGVYASHRTMNGWPWLPDMHSIDKRMSELHNDGIIRPQTDDEGVQVRVMSPLGKTASVWEIVPEAVN